MKKLAPKIRFYKKALENIEIRLVQNERELYDALSLLQKVYGEEGFVSQSDSSMRVTPYHLLPETAVFVAIKRGQVIGTVSCIGRSQIGHPFSKLLTKDQRISLDGKWYGEVSSLAVHPDHRVGGQIFFALSLLCHLYTKKYQQLNEFYIAVNPKQIRFYKDVLQMKVVSDVFESYKFVSGAPAQVLSQNLDQFESRWEEFFDSFPDESNWHQHLSQWSSLGIQMPKIEDIIPSDTILTPEILSTLISHLTLEDCQYLQENALGLLSHLSQPDFKLVLQSSKLKLDTSLCRRSHRRVPVKNIEAHIYGNSVVPLKMRVANVSLMGIELRGVSKRAVPKRGAIQLRVFGRNHCLKYEQMKATSGGCVVFFKTNQSDEWSSLFRVNEVKEDYHLAG